MTQILCIMDRSGSMSHLTTEVVGAFNAFVDEQKKVKGRANLTLVVFDHEYKVVFDKLALSKVPTLTRDQVTARGATALYDAIGKTITRAKDNNKTIVLIQTDGYENSSQIYNRAQIRDVIEAKQEQGWEFVFIGAGMAAMTEAAAISIQNAHQVTRDAKGMTAYSNIIGAATTSYRSQ